MLNGPTLWVVFIFNFLALGLIWTYVVRSYPSFHAARYWTAGAYVAAAGASFGILRGVIDSPWPLVGAGVLIVLACCLEGMGIERFYGRTRSWRPTIVITVLTALGLCVFTGLYDSMPMRILVYSVGQSVPVALTLRHVLSRNGRRSPGARMAGIVAIMMIGLFTIRASAALLNFGGDMSMVHFNDFQSAMLLALVFLSMTWNFGFLLMAIDRLRAEVEDLALLDDLTGIANRRHLLRRLSEQCDLSARTGAPFAVLAIDLDGFKAINDGHGHGAGDECLRSFTRAAQTRLRPGDLLARSGGDEFCVVLPATTWREGAMIARHLLEECRNQLASCNGVEISIAASIGVAQWSRQIGAHPERLIAAADQALYTAKKLGKDRYAIYEPATGPAPLAEPLRKIA
jgi:diguanylate cyclase (GGDEF)-like protein